MGAGSTTAGMVFGGSEPAASAKTELWDGTSWTEVADLATARQGSGSAGTTLSALCCGGNPGYVNITEAWDGAPVAVRTRDNKLKMNYKKIKGGNYGKYILYSD